MNNFAMEQHVGFSYKDVEGWKQEGFVGLEENKLCSSDEKTVIAL